MAFKFQSLNVQKLFNVDSTNFEYKSLSEIREEYGKDTFTARGFYINTKGMFGDSPVVATANEYVNLPQHLTDVIKQIIENKEAVDAVNAGKCGFKVVDYTRKEYGEKTFQSIEFFDIEG